jgi:hypothetical protein
MVRRTLEEVCAERQAQGRDLKSRIADLRTKIVIPQELLDAMEELRVLGNDAALTATSCAQYIKSNRFCRTFQRSVNRALSFNKLLHVWGSQLSGWLLLAGPGSTVRFGPTHI